MTALVLLELDGGSPSDSSLRTLTLARSTGRPVAAVVFGTVENPDTLAMHGVSDLYQISSSALDGYAPVAWARALAGLIADLNATAVMSAATDRGNEVMAHLGAITGLPMAANCVSLAGSAGAFSLVRHRWAGLLLEDATLE